MEESIKIRKDSIFNYYEVKDKKLLDEINNLFEEIEAFASTKKDVAEFESDFASSELNQRYLDLMTKVATTCKFKDAMKNQAKEYMEHADHKQELKDELKYQAESLSMPFRRKARQEVYDKARDIPGVGEVMQVNQMRSLFGRFRKKDK